MKKSAMQFFDADRQIPPPYFKYWGKADENYAGEPKWHPLVYHCLDVAACASVLLERQPGWLAALSRQAGLEPEWLRSWLHFQTAIHDIGKFGDGFQAWRPDLLATLQGRRGINPGGERHDALGYVLAEQYLLDWLGLDGQDPDLFDLIQPWIAAVTGHHGRPAKNLHDAKLLLLRNHYPLPVLEDASSFVTQAARLFLPADFTFPTPEAGLAERYRHASWLVAGLTVAADWLGSNTRWFPYRAPVHSLNEYWKEFALPQARRAVEESGLVPATPTALPCIRALFPGVSMPTPLQAWAEKVEIASGSQIFVLEELTGAGKTEAALTLAARLMAAGEAQGLYLALPTMATADAMFDRVRKDDGWRRFFAAGAGQLALAHSADWLKLRLEEMNRRDAGYGRGEDASASRQCSAWLADSRKKALLADFGVGTLDQALLAVLPAKHQSLRLLGLANKVLIVDEVHACDCYMGELLARLLRFHAALGGSAILLSATLPQNQRARYLQSFAQGAGFAAESPQSDAYPLATRLARSDFTEQALTARESVSRRVETTLLHEEAQALAHLEGAIAQGRCAVWVRNTVADAVETWRQWNVAHPDRPATTLYHARFALQDRLGIGARLLADFGPDSGPGTRNGRLVIATQVVEQSLDVDFDDMVSDLAPIDLVIQRAGRLQRHRRDASGNRVPVETPDGRGGAQLAVLTPEPVPEADAKWIKGLLPKTGKVYPDHGKLWLTARWLAGEGGFEVPRQARAMIEAVYDEAAFDELPEPLQSVANAADGACRADRGAARGNLLNFDEGCTPTNLIWQDEGEAPTRLGEATARVRLARVAEDALVPWAEVDAGIAWALSELTVPRRLIAAESPRDGALVAAARQAMSDEGRYVVIVALRPVDDTWRGQALNAGGEEIHVIYSPVCGLTIEKGAEDESDL
ncbi:MAG: CRISPR-associated helicase Cas3' [Acidithiobacillus sp.]